MESQTPGGELDDAPLNSTDGNLADSTNVVNTINLRFINECDDGEITTWIAAEILKSEIQWSGKTAKNTVVVFPKEHYKIGDFVDVKIEKCTSATLIGNAVGYSKSV